MTYLNQLNFNVNGNLLTLNNKPMVTSGSVNFDTCTFNFNKVWRGFFKTAVFTMEDDDTCCVSLENTSTCKIPSECLMKRGILKIGVVGEKEDGTVISTNLVAHRVVQGANEEDIDLPDETQPEQPIIPSPESKSAVALWEDDRISLPENTVIDDYLNVDETDIQSYYDITFSRLARLYPDYVTRVTELEDSTGNPIDSFTFAGEHYDRTILISANHLGHSISSLLALGTFFRQLCENYESNPALRFLHNKVKFVVLPIISPQAMMLHSRQNDNAVAPFVNYDNFWDNSPIEDKGEGVFTELETIAFLNVLENVLNDNLIWVFDFETNSQSSIAKKIYFKANYRNEMNLINEAVNKFNSKYSSSASVRNVEYYESQAPIATNYTSFAYNKNACTIMWSGDSNENVNVDNILSYSDFIANITYEVAKKSGEIKSIPSKPIVKHIMWRGSVEDDNFYKTTMSITPVWISAHKQVLFGNYNVHMTGYAIVESEKNTKARIRPILTQGNSPTDDIDTRLTNYDYDVEITTNVGVNVIPFDTVFKCNYTNGSNTSNPSLLYSLISAASQLSVKLTGFSYTLTFIPSDEKDSVEVLTPPGKVSDYTDRYNTPIFEQKYPKLFHDII